MADLEFEVAPRRREPITFKLGGDRAVIRAAEGPSEEFPEGRDAERGRDDTTYLFDPPKNAVMLMPLMDGSTGSVGLGLTKATFDWLGKGMSKEHNDHLLARLRDEDDDLDISTVEKVIEALSERVAGRPTT